MNSPPSRVATSAPAATTASPGDSTSARCEKQASRARRYRARSLPTKRGSCSRPVFRRKSEASTGVRVSVSSERADKGEDHRQGHRLEHLPLDAAEREDREVDDDDDPDPERDGPDDLVRGLGRELPHRLVASIGLAEPADDVLHQHHRPVDDQPEVDRAQAHEVRRDAGLHHAGEREQHRERDGRGHDEPGADVAEKGEEDSHDEDGSFEQVRLDRADDAADEGARGRSTGRSGLPSAARAAALPPPGGRESPPAGRSHRRASGRGR